MFAAGAVCDELLSYTVGVVRDEDTPASVMMRIMNADMVPIAELCHGLPPEIAQIVHTALAKSPKARFPMGVMKAAIENAARHAKRHWDPRHTASNISAPVVAGPRTAQAAEQSRQRRPRNCRSSRARQRLAYAAAIAPAHRRDCCRGARCRCCRRLVGFAAGRAATWLGHGRVDAVNLREVTQLQKNAPTPLALGEVVTGRLAASNEPGRRHYWVVDLPAGDFKPVVDARRTDDDKSNIIATISWVDDDGATGGQIGNLNAIGDRTARFSILHR